MENTGKLPDSLENLQKADLLQKIPDYPFSGTSVKYKRQNGNFTVYSYGLDFDDDGGLSDSFMLISKGDLVFWPIEKQKWGSNNP